MTFHWNNDLLQNRLLTSVTKVLKHYRLSSATRIGNATNYGQRTRDHSLSLGMKSRFFGINPIFTKLIPTNSGGMTRVKTELLYGVQKNTSQRKLKTCKKEAFWWTPKWKYAIWEMDAVNFFKSCFYPLAR